MREGTRRLIVFIDGGRFGAGYVLGTVADETIREATDTWDVQSHAEPQEPIGLGGSGRIEFRRSRARQAMRWLMPLEQGACALRHPIRGGYDRIRGYAVTVITDHANLVAPVGVGEAQRLMHRCSVQAPRQRVEEIESWMCNPGVRLSFAAGGQNAADYWSRALESARIAGGRGESIW